MIESRASSLGVIAVIASFAACSNGARPPAVTTPAPVASAPTSEPPAPPRKVAELAKIGKDEKVTSICADATTVYYTVFAGASSRLMRIARTGGTAELLAKGDKIFDHCALDGDTVYWSALSRLLRLPKASAPESGAEKELFDGGVFFPVNDIAIDETHVYFTTQGALQRMAKAGGKPEVLAFHPLVDNVTFADPVLDATQILALRVETEKQLYELVRFSKTAPAGAKPEVIARYQRAPDTPFAGSGMGAPVLAGGFIHWSQGDRQILRAPVSGGKAESLFVADALVLALAVDGARIAYASAGKDEKTRALVHVTADASGKSWKESGRSAFSPVFVIDRGALIGAFPEGEENGGAVGRIDL